jgi:hypothetical protein
MPITVPRGLRIYSGHDELDTVIEKLKAGGFSGYVEVAGKRNGELHIGTIVFLDGEIVIAGLENVITKSEFFGEKALMSIAELEKTNYEVFQLDNSKIKLAYEFNPKESYLIEPVREEKIEKETIREPYHTLPDTTILTKPPATETRENLLNFISKLENFTGMIKARAGNEEIILFLEDDTIVAAMLNRGVERIKGAPVLKFLSTEAQIKIYPKSAEEVERLINKSPEMRVIYSEIEPGITFAETEEVKREEVLRKYGIKPLSEKEIEGVLKTTDQTDIFGFIKKNTLQKIKFLKISKK